MVAFGVFGKFGALLATIPDPVIGGYIAVAMSMVVGAGIANLKNANLQVKTCQFDSSMILRSRNSDVLY